MIDKPDRIDMLVLSIATKHFTVPLPSGKDVIRAVNLYPLLEEIIAHFKNEDQKCLCYKATDFARQFDGQKGDCGK